MERLILFAKRPRLGAVKTRLVPRLQPEQVLALYTAFLQDQLRFVLSFYGPERAVELCADGPWTVPASFARLPEELERTQQGAGDLGERMLRAFTRSRGNAAATVIVGADAPTLPHDHVTEAFRRLAAGVPAVVSPAEDGGYVLIGMAEPLPELLRGIPWGGGRVLEATRRQARQRAIRFEEIDPWYDVDDPGGLDRLRLDLRAAHARERAPATSALLDRLKL
jgi:hypothetical protein